MRIAMQASAVARTEAQRAFVSNYVSVGDQCANEITPDVLIVRDLTYGPWAGMSMGSRRDTMATVPWHIQVATSQRGTVQD